MANGRRTLAVRISDEARSALEAYCQEQGITVTAFVEAVGHQIIDLRADTPSDKALRRAAADTVRIARQIDSERRARGPGGKS
ncbi:MAG: hypothetical protein WD691_12685 [Acidimicrobiales bacterium]